jgi:hypothetical protein
MVSLAARVLLSVHLALGQVIPATLCNDLTVHGKLLQAVQEMCTYIGVGSTGVMSKTTGLIVQTLATSVSLLCSTEPSKLTIACLVFQHDLGSDRFVAAPEASASHEAYASLGAPLPLPERRKSGGR